MSTSLRTDGGFMEAAIKSEIKKQIELDIALAVQDFETRLRKNIGGLVLSVMKHYDVSQMGDIVTIKVRHVEG